MGGGGGGGRVVGRAAPHAVNLCLQNSFGESHSIESSKHFRELFVLYFRALTVHPVFEDEQSKESDKSHKQRVENRKRIEVVQLNSRGVEVGVKSFGGGGGVSLDRCPGGGIKFVRG